MNGWKVSAAAPNNRNCAKDNKYTGLSTRQERQRKKKQSEYDSIFQHEPNKSNRIVVIFDVQGSLTGLDDEKAKKLNDYLHFLRVKYAVKEVAVSLVSRSHNYSELLNYMEILKRNFGKSIKLDNSHTVHMTINPDTLTAVGRCAFDNPMIFKSYYNDKITKWIGIFDNSYGTNILSDYKGDQPIVLFRPSCKHETDLKYDNAICYSTQTEGIDGVLETLQIYCDKLVNTSANSLTEEQKKCLVHPGSGMIQRLCKNRDYDMLIRYMTETKLFEGDYKIIMNHILSVGEFISQEELIKLREIVTIVQQNMTPKHVLALSLLKEYVGI